MNNNICCFITVIELSNCKLYCCGFQTARYETCISLITITNTKLNLTNCTEALA